MLPLYILGYLLFTTALRISVKLKDEWTKGTGNLTPAWNMIKRNYEFSINNKTFIWETNISAVHDGLYTSSVFFLNLCTKECFRDNNRPDKILLISYLSCKLYFSRKFIIKLSELQLFHLFSLNTGLKIYLFFCLLLEVIK